MKNGMEVDISLNKIWYKDDKFHRDGDLPAIECDNGTKHWYQNGLRHRDGDKPAIEWSNGAKSWFEKNENHRVGKPANEYISSHTNTWFLNGNQYYSEKEYRIELSKQYGLVIRNKRKLK